MVAKINSSGMRGIWIRLRFAITSASANVQYNRGRATGFKGWVFLIAVILIVGSFLRAAPRAFLLLPVSLLRQRRVRSGSGIHHPGWVCARRYLRGELAQHRGRAQPGREF